MMTHSRDAGTGNPSNIKTLLALDIDDPPRDVGAVRRNHTIGSDVEESLLEETRKTRE